MSIRQDNKTQALNHELCALLSLFFICIGKICLVYFPTWHLLKCETQVWRKGFDTR
jgi:hypothetical protein